MGRSVRRVSRGRDRGGITFLQGQPLTWKPNATATNSASLSSTVGASTGRVVGLICIAPQHPATASDRTTSQSQIRVFAVLVIVIPLCPCVLRPVQPVRARRGGGRSEEHTSELQSRFDLVCRLLLEKKK